MREGAGDNIWGRRSSTAAAAAQGLTPLVGRYRIRKRLKDLEVTERRQVGDAQDLINRASAGTSSGDFGMFRDHHWDV
jgi:pyruvate dehydrogenase kinase 2/3/4